MSRSVSCRSRFARVVAHAVGLGLVAAVLPAGPAAATGHLHAPSTKLYLRSENGGYSQDFDADPTALSGLRAPRGSTLSVLPPTRIAESTATNLSGTVPGSPATPTFAVPVTHKGTVHGVCVDLWLSKSGGKTPNEIHVTVAFKGPIQAAQYALPMLKTYYTPGDVVRIVGYLKNPNSSYAMGANTSMFVNTFVDDDVALKVHYDSLTRPSSITLNGDAATCPSPPAPPPAPYPLLGQEQPTYSVHQVPRDLLGSAPHPSVGVDWSTGTTVVQAGQRTLRIDGFGSDDGPRWADATPLLAGAASSEPALVTSPQTRRTYVSQVVSGCGDLAVSDDSARHWAENPAGCPVGSIRDHVIGVGPYALPLPTGIRHPEALYYCGHANAVTSCARSNDGGLTFGPPRPIYSFGNCFPTPGKVVVAPDGTVYVPNKNCGGRQAVVVSEDNGETWEVRAIPGSVASEESDPSVAVAADGTVYAAFTRADGAGSKAFAAVSRNKGRTWTWLRDVGAHAEGGGILNAQFPVAVAGDGDRAAVAFVGTSLDGNDQLDKFGGTWHLWVATTVTGGHDWTVVDATGGDPVQRGCIFTSTTATAVAAQCANLGRSISATIDRTGRVLVAFADGCLTLCAEAEHASTSAAATVARQEGGVRLYALPEPSVPDVVRPVATAGDGVVDVAWDEPADNGRAIHGYTVFRGLAPNPVTPYADLPRTARSFTDTGVNRGLTYHYTVAASNAIGRGQHFVESAATAYVPGAVDAARSGATAFPSAVPANGTTASAVTVVLRDAEGNPVSGKRVTLSKATGPGAPVISPSSATTNTDGKAVFGVRSVTAGHVGFRAYDATDDITVTQLAEVDFLAGAVDPDGSSVTASPTTVTANGVAESAVVATLRDSYGNGVPGQLVDLEHTAGGGSPVVDPPSARTDAAGVARFAVRSTVAATDTFTARDATEGTVVAQTASVTFVPGPADEAGSTLTVDVATLPSDGTSVATFAATIVDAHGNPAPGRTVRLDEVAGVTGRTISPATATTDADGLVTFTARSTRSGATTFAAVVMTDGVTVAQQAEVSFEYGAASAATSDVTATPGTVVADGAEVEVVVTLRDVNDNPIPGKVVSVAKTGPGTLSPATATTDADGRATFTLTSTVTGEATVSATDDTDGVPVTDTATVTFVPGPVSGFASGLTADVATQAADGAGAVTFVATLRDQYGNVVPGKTVALTKESGPGAPVISPASAGTDAAGDAVFTVRSTVAGDMTFRATDTSDGVAVAQTVPVTFTVGAVSASASGVVATPTSVVADGTTSTVVVTLRDAQQNAVAGKTVTLEQTAGPGGPTLSPASAVTGANGAAAFTVASTVAGVATYRATDTDDELVVTQTAQVTFRTGPVSATASGLTATPATVTADGVTTSTVVATLRDAYGNGVSGKTVTLAKVAGPGSPTIAPASVVTGSSGQAAFTVKSTTAGLTTYRATNTTDAVTVTQTADVTFAVGAVSASVSGVSASPASVVADGAAATTVTVTLRDAQGNAVSGKTVTLAKASGPGTTTIAPASAVTNGSGQVTFTATTTTAGSYAFRATDTTDGVVVTQTAAVTFTPGAVSASVSTLTATPQTVAADGVATSTVVATLRDAQGNAVSGKTVTLAKVAGPGSPTIAPASVVTGASGEASFTVKSTTAGLTTYRATNTTDSMTVTQTADVTFAVGAVSASVSGVTASPTSVVADGAAATSVTVTLRDAQGNAVSGKTVTLAKASGPGTTTIAPASAVTSGSGQVTFTATTTTAGSYAFRATDTSDGIVVTQTAAVTFTAGVATAAASSVTASGNVPNDGSTAATVTVVLRDAHANPAPGRTVTLAKSAGSASPTITPASRVTDAAGTATFSVTATTAGTATFQATGATDGIVVTQTADVTFVPPPDVPTGLTATPGNAQVALSWTAATAGTAPTGYRVYQGGTLVRTVAAPTTTTTLTGLTDGTTYSFQVSAYHDAYREGTKTAAVSATPRAVPGVPTGLTATPADGTVSLSWTAPTGTAPTEYRVWENGTHVLTVGTTSVQRTGRANGTAYSYEVQAHATNYGTSAKTAAVSATPVAAPAAPTALAAAPGDGEVVLTWTAPASTAAAPVTGQRVYVDGSATPVATLAASTATYRATGFANFTAHTFVVASYNGTGETRTASVGATPTAPPTALTVGTVGTTTAALSWTAPSGPPAGYRVYVDGVVHATVTTTSTTITGLIGGTSYAVAVAAISGATPAVESAKTSSVTVLTKPGTPTGLTLTNGNRELGVAWTAPAGGAPAGYYVHLDGALAATVTSGTSTTLASLVNGQSYSVTVTAYNGTGDSAATAAATGTPALPAPAYYALSDTSTGTGADVKVTYYFYPVDNATGYRLYRDGVLVTSTFRTFLTTRRAMDDTGRSFTTSYNYTVAAVDGTHVGPQMPVRTMVTQPDDVPSSLSFEYLCGTVANTYKLRFTWSAPAKGTWTGFRIYNADGTVSGNVGSTIRTYTTGNQPETSDGAGGYRFYSNFNTVNTGSTTPESDGYNPQGSTTKNC